MSDGPVSPTEATRGSRRPPRSTLSHQALEALKDNIEAFTIALIMALVIKHFCVEAFKIPTGSMEPTLRGEEAHGVGDRILVDKNAYLISDPQRWDIVVFRFPLNRAKHFIKRVASGGGEYLRIVRGDLWVRKTKDDPWRIATKPRRARSELYRPVFPPLQQGADAYNTAGEQWEAGDGWEVLDYDRLRFTGEEAAKVRLTKTIGQSSSNSYEGLWGSGSLVHDIRIRLRLEPSDGASVTLHWNTAEGHETSIHLASADAAEGSWVGTRRPGRALRDRLPVRLESGRAADVELECVDGEVHVHANGKPLVRLDLNRPLEQTREFEDFTQVFEIEASGGSVDVEAIRLDRDIEYQDDEMYALEDGESGVWVPEDHLFMLGDNTDSSHDSRKWELKFVTLMSGGEIVYNYDTKDPPTRGPGQTTVTDRDGIRRTWQHADVATDGHRTERAPFVPRDLVVGRAFFVFWPLTPEFPGRLGFIH